MPLITHHTDDIIHMDTVAICGSQLWHHITTGWESVTCPACLNLRPEAAQPAAVCDHDWITVVLSPLTRRCRKCGVER